MSSAMLGIGMVKRERNGMSTRIINGFTVFMLPDLCPQLRTEAEVTDLIGDAFATRADWVAVPVAQLSPMFLNLSSGFAGAVIQKFVNYRVGLAVVGQIDDALAGSSALRDFVYETNRGSACWFVDDLAALEEKLQSLTAGHC
ncbi:hypothetical protein WP8S17C03_00820 [Metapseudomonas otitidis]|uniref:DUF4180 domain-containing protein n=1 Tax=Metapseudomonas otitidis TaxID=319939 RepID=A0A6S5RFQ1_9GAMM|nr:DUF4180 domain-containing protein [Pseudomonas otitidis]BBT14033.1 hypothetical protein WP8S17C03_00820 [Pseudomonas otitidis]